MSIDWIPARKITAKERGNHGFFPTKKNPKRFVEYESQKERNLFLLLEHASDVRRFQHQPKTITYQDNKGKTHHYTFDVYIEFMDGAKVFCEVKLEEEIEEKQEDFKEKWDAARKWAKDNGYIFIVLTDIEIETPRWANIWFTLGASKCIENDKFISKLNLQIPNEGIEYNRLCYKLAMNLGIQITKAAQIICYAIYHGLVFIDTFSTKEISKDTMIHRVSDSEQKPFQTFWDEYVDLEKLESNQPEIEDSAEELKEISENLTLIPEKYKEEVEKREKIVKEWLSTPSTKRVPQFREEFSSKWEIPIRTIYHWIKSFEDMGLEGLIPKYENAGRKTKLSPEILELLEDARRYFLKPGITLKEAYRKLGNLCSDKKLDCPPKSSFQGYIYQNTSASEKGWKHGRKYHKSHFTPSLGSFQGAFIPMQIIQMDNTPYDVFPVDSEERQSLSTPYMTTAIDCCTKMITGFDLSYFPSSSQTVLEVLTQTILPKNEITKKNDILQEWPIQGFPILILVDNGMDYRSNALREFCLKYDIILEYVPIRTPRYKAYIEQWFNILRQALKTERVSGHRPLLRERIENPDLKPETEAICTLQELTSWLYEWVLSEYHLSNFYDDHVIAPYLKWKEIQEGRTPLIFPQAREPPKDKKEIDVLIISAFDQEERTLRSDGIVWEHLKYNNKALAGIFSTIGENNNVKILRDRRDIRKIWVIDPINGQPIPVGLASGWASALVEIYGDFPIHASAWKNDVQNIKIRSKDKLTPFLYTKESSRIKRDEIVNNAHQMKKSIRKEKEKMKEAQIKSKNVQEAELTTHNDNEIDDTFNDLFENHQPELLSSSNMEKEDIFDTYQPKGLVVSKYPHVSEKEE